jgi:hypothetical protein
MATLALGLAGAGLGSALGGYAALGFSIGSALGNYFFTPAQKVEGPRLSDLRVQGSAYGAPIPWVRGTMRLAGQVVWSDGLREERHTESAGKGGPKVETTSYTYTASFAVMLCAGPIAGVRRI